jgi:hypothetical protein
MRYLAILVVLFALIGAGCGGGSTSDTEEEAADTTFAATATTTAAPTTTAALATTVAPTTTVAPASADGVSPQIATVEAMYDALNAHDADTYAVYWAEDAEGWGPYFWGRNKVPVGSPEMDQGFEQRRAWGAHYALADCELIDETVRCLETLDDRVYHGMAGLTYDREVTYTFDEQGMITIMGNHNANGAELNDFGEVFGPWVLSSHPEIAETYLVPGFEQAWKEDVIFASPENIAEFTGLIEEFVAQSDTYPLTP